MHGVCDSSQTWVVHGREKSAAYLAHRCGFDVFLGNFRGVYPRKLAPWKAKSGVSYWNYNIDHLAKFDISAFIKTIYEVKLDEFKAFIKGSGADYTSDAEIEAELRQKIKITYVGHSMGGMTLPIYVIHSNRTKKPHGLSQAILLSPAGIHTKERVTSYMHYIGLFFYSLLPLVCDHVALPDFAIRLS